MKNTKQRLKIKLSPLIKMMNINLSIKVIFCCTILHCATFPLSLHSQTWVNNEFSNLIDNHYVYDIIVKNDTNIWTLTNAGLLIYEGNNKLINYDIAYNSNGLFSQFQKTDALVYKHYYTDLVCNDSVLFLLNRENSNLSFLINDSVISVFNKDIPDNYKLKFFGIANNKLWLIYEYYKNKKDKYLISTFDYLQKEFIQIKIDYIFEDIDLFFVKGANKYFLSEGYLRTINENNKVSKIKLDALRKNNLTSCNYFVCKDTIYLLSAEGDFYKISNSKFNHLKLNIQENLYSNFTFIYDSNKVYISSMEGLIIYDTLNDVYSFSTPPDFQNHCTFGFEKLIKSDDYIYALYGNAIKNQCLNNNYGLSILDLNIVKH